MLVLIGDKNFRGKGFEAELAKLDATIMRPRRKEATGPQPSTTPHTTPALRPASQITRQPRRADGPPHEPQLAAIRQRIESTF